MKKLILIYFLSLCIFLLVGCDIPIGEPEPDENTEHIHHGGVASCQREAICTVCGESYGEKADHDYADASCVSPKACKVCGVWLGAPLEHDLAPATCTVPRICKSCGRRFGDPLGHNYTEASCTELQRCLNCGDTKGKLLDHSFSDATCMTPKTCVLCGATDGEPLDHNYSIPTCTTARVCLDCGASDGLFADHEFTEATDDTPGFCKNCGITNDCDHSFDPWAVNVPPTCTDPGERSRLCEICHCVQKDIIPKTEHNIVTIESIAPTCEKEGMTEGKYCSICDEVLLPQYSIKKLPHEYENEKCINCGAQQLLSGSEGLEFEKTDSGYAVTGLGTCRESILVIPSIYNGQPVTEIATLYPTSDGYFPREIIIPDSIKTVKMYAIDCNNFIRIIVGENAVFETQSLELAGGCEIIYSSANGVPSSALTAKREYAPYVIHNEKESRCHTTSEGFVFLDYNGTAYLCDYIGSASDLILPDGHKGKNYILSANCFYGNKYIKSVKIGYGVSRIGEAAFCNSMISDIDLNGAFTEIPPFCFYGCSMLQSVIIPDNVLTIQSQSFDQTGLKTVSIGRNVTSINVFAFDDSPDLDTLYFNAENCTDISYSSLRGFKNLVIGPDVQLISKNFMKANTSLISITFDENSSCKRIESDAFSKTSITEIALPKSLTQVYSGFEDCQALERIYINCQAISTSSTVFYNCGSSGNGIEVIVSSDVTLLPANFFKNCYIKGLVFESESNCKTVGSAFSSNRISNVTLPASIESFDTNSFTLSTLKIDENNSTYTLMDSCIIFVKDSKLIAVTGQDYVIPSFVTTVGKNAFYGSGITHIYIPDTVTYLEEGCLNCQTVQSISLPFIGHEKNTPTKLLELFTNEHHYGYITVDLNAGTTIHKRFYVPKEFSELTVRGGNISNGLTGLSMLKEIYISEKVTTITREAFSSCKNISKIYYGGNEEQWNQLCETNWLYNVPEAVIVLNVEIID